MTIYGDLNLIFCSDREKYPSLFTSGPALREDCDQAQTFIKNHYMGFRKVVQILGYIPCVSLIVACARLAINHNNLERNDQLNLRCALEIYCISIILLPFDIIGDLYHLSVSSYYKLNIEKKLEQKNYEYLNKIPPRYICSYFRKYPEKLAEHIPFLNLQCRQFILLRLEDANIKKIISAMNLTTSPLSDTHKALLIQPLFNNLKKCYQRMFFSNITSSDLRALFSSIKMGEKLKVIPNLNLQQKEDLLKEDLLPRSFKAWNTKHSDSLIPSILFYNTEMHEEYRNSFLEGDHPLEKENVNVRFKVLSDEIKKIQIEAIQVLKPEVEINDENFDKLKEEALKALFPGQSLTPEDFQDQLTNNYLSNPINISMCQTPYYVDYTTLFLMTNSSGKFKHPLTRDGEFLNRYSVDEPFKALIDQFIP